MSDLTEQLKHSLATEDARYAYVEAFQNAHIAAQLKAMRQAEGWSQEKLGKMVGTQPHPCKLAFDHRGQV